MRQGAPCIGSLTKYQIIETLSRKIFTYLIDYIKVYESDNISVHFKFADESHNLAEYIEHNTTGTAEAGAPAKAQNPFDGAFF